MLGLMPNIPGRAYQVSYQHRDFPKEVEEIKLKNIILVGFMGTGKTVVGHELSKSLSIPFVDTDDIIKKNSGMKISEIFEQFGEKHFRNLESEAVKEACSHKSAVIAAGGGAVIRRKNVEVMKESGIVFCLESSPEEIWRRVKSETHRPLLQVSDPLKKIKQILADRAPYYARADYTIDTTGLSVSDVSAKIVKIYQNKDKTYKASKTSKVCDSIKQKVEINLGVNSYPIYIGNKNLSELGQLLVEKGLAHKNSIITNPTVNRHYGEIVKDSLQQSGIEAKIIEVPDGEEYKSYESAYKLYDMMIDQKMDRTSTVISLGGGVIGDLAGFVAATYMRGIPFVQIPTTLLAQVDASIGGKVAINHPKGKNLIGAFYQPKFVLIDLSTLYTLPMRDVRSGMAELIKHGMIMDRPLFEKIESEFDKVLELDKDLMIELVAQSCRDKGTIVQKDEKESGIRAILNYGHTFAHAIESLTDYKKYRHGEAVSIGMACAGRLSVDMELLDKDEHKRQIELLTAVGLPTKFPDIDPQKVLETMYLDKKVRGGKLRFVLQKSIGEVIITDKVTDEQVMEAITRET